MHPSQRLPRFTYFVLGAFLALCPSPSPAKTATITFKTDVTSYTVTFDDSKISESEIRALIPLSPNVGTYANLPSTQNFFMTRSANAGAVFDKTLIALPIEFCPTDDPAYAGCYNNVISSPHFLANASINLEKSRKGLAWLQSLPHPKELQPVIDYLVKQLSTSISIEDAKFRYFSTWDVTILKGKLAGLDDAPSCPDVFKELNAAKSKEEKYNVVAHDWLSCVLNAARYKKGTYPLNSWKAFAQDFTIQEKYVE